MEGNPGTDPTVCAGCYPLLLLPSACVVPRVDWKGTLPLILSAWWEWQTGKHVQHSAVMGLEQRLMAGDGRLMAVSRLRGSAPLKEFSFPPDAGSCGLSICMTDGGVLPSAQQGSMLFVLVELQETTHPLG